MSEYDPKGTLITVPEPSSTVQEAAKHDIFADGNPASLKNKLGPCDFLDQVGAHFAFDPGLFSKSEPDLAKWLKSHGMEVTALDNRLRYKLWMEYDSACENDRKMQLANIFGGVMTYRAFTEYYMNKREKVAWLLCPPISYTVAAREALGFGVEKMREYLSVDIKRPDGSIDPKMARFAELQFKIATWLDMREHGSFTQRTESKNLHVTMTDKTAQKMIDTMTKEGSEQALTAELEKLEERERKALNLPAKKKEPQVANVIDVTPEPGSVKKTDF